MKRSHGILLGALAIGIFFFLPLFQDGGPIPSDCVYCPNSLWPYYSSASYALLGVGEVYNQNFGYSFRAWGTHIFELVELKQKTPSSFT